MGARQDKPAAGADDNDQGAPRLLDVELIRKQLDAAQQITHIGSWEWNVATNEVTWSNELFRIYGLEPQSRRIDLQFFLERLHGDEQERVANEVRRAMARGGRFQWFERIVRPNGDVRELDTVGEAIRDEQGSVIGLIGTCRDVTEKRRRDEIICLYADIVRNVQIGLTVWEAVVVPSGDTYRLRAFNPAAEAAIGKSLDGQIGKPLSEVFPLEVGKQRSPLSVGTELPTLLSAVREDGIVRSVAALALGPSVFAIKAFRLPNLTVGLAFEDITASARAQRIEAAEQKVFEMIASRSPLADVMRELVRSFEQESPGAKGSVLVLDPNGVQLRHCVGASLPDAFNRAVDGAEIGPDAGSCGTAAYLKRTVTVTDIETDPLWARYRDLVRPFALRACTSTPILSSDGHVLGTFAIYFSERRTFTETESQLIARASYVARIAIERDQLEDQLRALSAHIESIREEERATIAREIHDELGQSLTAIKLDLSWIARRVTEAKPLDRAAVLDKLGEASKMTDDVVKLVRRIATELRPGVLDDLGLPAAIEWQSEEFARHTGTPCQVSFDVGSLRIDRDLSTNLFRIFQEALTNVARHARARKVDARLCWEGGALVLVVRDDGRGISPEAAMHPRSLGLLGIRERARRLGGSAVIGGAPRQGTSVTVTVPVETCRPGSAP